MTELTKAQLRSLIGNNQTAICQLGKDIIELSEKIDKRVRDVEKAHHSMHRDIKDRWAIISEISKSIDELSKKKIR